MTVLLAVGFWLMIWSLGTLSLACWDVVPTSRPAAWSSERAASTVLPVTEGTLTVSVLVDVLVSVVLDAATPVVSVPFTPGVFVPPAQPRRAKTMTRTSAMMTTATMPAMAGPGRPWRSCVMEPLDPPLPPAPPRPLPTGPAALFMPTARFMACVLAMRRVGSVWPRSGVVPVAPPCMTVVCVAEGLMTRVVVPRFSGRPMM